LPPNNCMCFIHAVYTDMFVNAKPGCSSQHEKGNTGSSSNSNNTTFEGLMKD